MPRYRNVRQPVLSAGARDRYLSREFNSFDFLKTVSKQELLAYAHEKGMRFATDSWQHQLVCFVIGTMCRAFAFYLKQSGGKSKIILDQIRYRKRTGELSRALITVPELLHVASWEEQIKEHAPDLRYQLAIGSRAQRERYLSKPADVVVTNYAGLMMFMTERKQVNRGIDEEGNAIVRGKQFINSDLASSFMIDNGFNFFDIDEIHRIVNMSSTYYNLFRWCMAAADFRYIMTGTAHGRDPSPLFSQFQLIDDGETFESPGMFQHAFFTPQAHPFKGTVWTFNRDTTADLHRVIKNRSITYEVTEYRDMPKKLVIRVPVRLSGESLEFYQRIVLGMKEARGDYRSLDNVYMRMRQCASGFIAMKADDKSRIEVQFKENPKLEALRDFLSTRDEKILVFHHFTPSGEIIEKMLEEERIKWAVIRGGTKDIAGEYERFKTQDSCKVFLLNDALGSEAINPQYVCRRAYIYEPPDDSKRYDQMIMRVYRQGQKWNVFINESVVLGTVEEKMMKHNRDGGNLLHAVMTGDDSLLIEEPV